MESSKQPELNARILSRCINKILSSSKIVEVPYMVSLTQIFPILVGCLGKFVHGGGKYRIEADGYLLHQKPIAKFKPRHGGDGCEIADFMVVCEDEGLRNQCAVLLQAKCSCEIDKETGVHTLSGRSSLNQLQLYTEWPRFNLEGDSYFFDLKPKKPISGAQYLILRTWRKPNTTVTKPALKMKVERPSLPAYLMGMLRFQDGYGKRFGAGRGNGEWTKLIEKLRQIIIGSAGLKCSSIDHRNVFYRCSNRALVGKIISAAISNNEQGYEELRESLKSLKKSLPDWCFRDEETYGMLIIKKEVEGRP